MNVLTFITCWRLMLIILNSISLFTCFSGVLLDCSLQTKDFQLFIISIIFYYMFYCFTLAFLISMICNIHLDCCTLTLEHKNL